MAKTTTKIKPQITADYCDEDKPLDTNEEKQTSVNLALTKKHVDEIIRVEVQKTLADIQAEEDKRTAKNAFKVFWAFMVFMSILFICSIVIHVLGIPELKAIEHLIIFSQGVLTTIIGFLFGTKMSYKK